MIQKPLFISLSVYVCISVDTGVEKQTLGCLHYSCYLGGWSARKIIYILCIYDLFCELVLNLTVKHFN